MNYDVSVSCGPNVGIVATNSPPSKCIEVAGAPFVYKIRVGVEQFKHNLQHVACGVCMNDGRVSE